MKKIFSILAGMAIAAFLVGFAQAGEHPGEHPASPAKSEHPGEAVEHPGEKAGLSAEDIIRRIKDHISSVAKANNGYFPITDAKEGNDLRLKLIRVHEDKISYVKKEDAYFVCTDFVTADGKANYDLDFWMKEKGEKLEVSQTKIHKKDGNLRFAYQDDEIVAVDAALEKKAPA